MGVIYGTVPLPPRQENYSLIEDDVVEQADVCIVGSGAAGSVLAKELAEQGRSVILLERGGYYEGKDMNQRSVDMMPLLWKNAGFNFDDDLKIAIAQGSCLGGSTIINDAVCFDPPKKVIDEWRQQGVNYTDEELETHTNKVNQILNVSEVTDEELNRNNLMLMLGAKKLGLREHRKNKRNCLNCMQCGYCHLGCHYETKQDMLQTYLHQALENQNSQIKIYCNCNVEKLERDETGKTIQGVEGTFMDSSGNKKFRIRVNAKIVIISGGAIASSKILLQNNIAQSTAGKGLCLHPAPFVIGDFDTEIKGNQGIPMSYTVHDFGVTRTNDQTVQEHNFSGKEFLIEGIYLPLLQFSMALPVDVGQHMQLMQRFNNFSMAGVLVRDGNNGRVSLTPTGRASVKYSLQSDEIKTISKGIEIIASMWFKLGAKRVITSLTSMPIINREDDLPNLLHELESHPENLRLGSAHPQSGNMIGTDPVNSVVDSDCKVHDFTNLFVCDASVFPTSVGVNPQITVMVIASIVAQRISEKWSECFSNIPVENSLGNTCAISQPMFCLRSNLSELFDSTETQYGIETLVNSSDESLSDGHNWEFDPQTLMIKNNTHWKGLFPRDADIPNTLTMYFGGFWKRFLQSNGGGDGNTVSGITHPYDTPVYAKNTASLKNLRGFGKIIQLDYEGPIYDQFHDVLKITDENTIVGKAYFGRPRKGQEILTFSMARRYPIDFMDESDHNMIYQKMTKPLQQKNIVGIWEGRLVSDSALSPPLFTFRYYFDQNDGVLKNDYLFGGILSGTAIVHEKDDHYEMTDVTQTFHDELKSINEDLLIGKYCSEANQIFDWMPQIGLSFLNFERNNQRVCLPYLLKKIGQESAYRGYS